MDDHINSQILNMKIIVKNFYEGCRVAFIKNDGKLDRNERRQLQQIEKACNHFLRDLSKIK